MKKQILSLVAVSLLASTFGSLHAAETGFNMLSDLKFKGEIRPRYESADLKDNGIPGAKAITARTTLGINAKLLEVEGLSTYIEGTSVNNFGYTNYDDNPKPGVGNSDGEYDVIVDPQQARITQAYIDYKAGSTLFRAGRQMINLDNQRFVGAVGWRQMFQTFDAAALMASPLSNLNVTLAYLYGVNGVTKIDKSADTNSLIANVAYKVADPLKITAYAYLLSNVRYQGNQSYGGSDTYGIAATGRFSVSESVQLNYRAEYATQTDPSLTYGTYVKPTNIDSDYYNADLGANFSGILAGINYEVLGANNKDAAGAAFATPLATGHKFNGWADKFLSTPSGGLKDSNIRLGYKAKGFGKMLAVYHDFTADKAMAAASGTSDDLGTELDLLYTNKIPGVNGLNGLIKYAAYNKGEVTGYTNDVDKFWLQLDYKF